MVKIAVFHTNGCVLLSGQTKKRKCLDWTWCLENGDLRVSRNPGTCFAGLVGNNINPICQSFFNLERVPLHSGTHKRHYCVSSVLICRTACYQLRPLGVRNIKHRGVDETNLKVCSVLFLNCFAIDVHFIWWFIRRKGCHVQGIKWEERQLLFCSSDSMTSSSCPFRTSSWIKDLWCWRHFNHLLGTLCSRNAPCSAKLGVGGIEPPNAVAFCSLGTVLANLYCLSSRTRWLGSPGEGFFRIIRAKVFHLQHY